tara:strand:+ start:810 stop:1019 length:210 start_codon:yes stop_codon:yes gene_type:complete
MNQELNQIAKSQFIRLLDVGVIGPVMIYGSILIPRSHPAVKAALFFFGASTVVFNWQNYQKIKRSSSAL